MQPQPPPDLTGRPLLLPQLSCSKTYTFSCSRTTASTGFAAMFILLAATAGPNGFGLLLAYMAAVAGPAVSAFLLIQGLSRRT